MIKRQKKERKNERMNDKDYIAFIYAKLCIENE